MHGGRGDAGCSAGARGERGVIIPRMAWRMLVLAALVFASGFTLRVAWESLEGGAR